MSILIENYSQNARNLKNTTLCVYPAIYHKLPFTAAVSVAKKRNENR